MAFSQDIHTPVRSEPLVNGKPVVKAPRKGGSEWAVGTALIIFGSIGWMTGSRYTLFGWVTGLNMFFAWLGLPLMVPMPIGWWILTMIPIGLVYSRVEMQVWKAHKRRGQSLALFAVSWLLIVATDVGTTYLGVRMPPADAWPITQSIAASTGWAFLWATILTFASDWLIIGGVKLIKR
jgi:hypothetical protein